MKTSRFLAVLLTIGFVLGCTKKGDQTTEGGKPAGSSIVIGEVGSFTGDTATFGISTHQGIELATNELNKAGGLLGKIVEIVKYDNQGKEEEAATATNRLINQHKVAAILGEVASRRSKAMAPIAQSNKVPMVSPSSTNPEVTAIGDYIFRVCFIDPFQGAVMARFAFENLKAKKVAILRDVGQDYSVGLADAFTETYKKVGGEIVSDQSYTEKDVDFKAQLTAIRGLNPEAIFVPGYYTQVGLIARQARELGIKAPLLGGDGWDSPKLFEIGGKAVEGSYLSNHYSPDDKSELVQNFIKRYKEAYGQIPDGLAAQGYDAAMVLFDAIKRAGSTDAKALRDALAATKEYPGVTGKITIDDKRNASKPAVVLKVENGGFSYVTSISP
ncbi:MAG: ABC transporter substrate-binding protein [Bdellovibrionales bacterium]|nr:ABC transporter substrate-binding protein [Bdellovibrionales bacterium]